MWIKQKVVLSVFWSWDHVQIRGLGSFTTCHKWAGKSGLRGALRTPPDPHSGRANDTDGMGLRPVGGNEFLHLYVCKYVEVLFRIVPRGKEGREEESEEEGECYTLYVDSRGTVQQCLLARPGAGTTRHCGCHRCAVSIASATWRASARQKPWPDCWPQRNPMTWLQTADHRQTPWLGYRPQAGALAWILTTGKPHGLAHVLATDCRQEPPLAFGHRQTPWLGCRPQAG
eukprot:gene24093-biopygen16391